MERLTHRPDFLSCARTFRRSMPSVTLEAAATPARFVQPETVRIGFTASRKSVGGSVERNRSKRRLRAAAAAQLPLYGVAGHDYVLVARPGTLTQPFACILEDLAALLRAARAKLARTQEP
jgi:ribonuclease P protein component